MKQIAPNYSYNKTTGVITLTGVNIDRDQLLLIVNTTRNVTYYNFADSATTLQAFTQGANTSITLASSVVSASSAHTDADALTIYYDDQASSGTVTANVGNISAIIGGGYNNLEEFAGSGGIGVNVVEGTVSLGAGTAQIGSVTASISNFPATQTIAGTVTAFGEDTVSGGFLPIPLNDGGEAVLVDIKGAFGSGVNVPISGTVTANLAPQANGPVIEIDSPIPNDPKYATIVGGFDTGAGDTRALRLGSSGGIIVQELPAISGTVTANLNDPTSAVIVGQIEDALFGSDQLINALNANLSLTSNVPISGTVTVGNSVTIGSLPPIAGTVTVGNSLSIQSGNISIEEVFGESSFVPISGTVNTSAVQGTTVSNTNFTSTTSDTLVSAVSTRKVLTVHNEGPATLFINAGSSVSTTSYQVRLLAGDYWEAPAGQQSLQHSGIFSSAGSAARVTEIS